MRSGRIDNTSNHHLPVGWADSAHAFTPGQICPSGYIRSNYHRVGRVRQSGGLSYAPYDYWLIAFLRELGNRSS